jgi:hypothetical protein
LDIPSKHVIDLELPILEGFGGTEWPAEDDDLVT